MEMFRAENRSESEGRIEQLLTRFVSEGESKRCMSSLRAISKDTGHPIEALANALTSVWEFERLARVAQSAPTMLLDLVRRAAVNSKTPQELGSVLASLHGAITQEG